MTPDSTTALDESPSPEVRGRSEFRCARCAKPVDPLRAARVAIFDDRFRYFCSAECRERYDPSAGRTPLPLPRTPRAEPAKAPDPEEAARRAAHRAAAALEDVEGDGLVSLGSRADEPQTEAAESAGEGQRSRILDEVLAPTDVGALLVGIAIVGGALSAALVLVGPFPMALTARVVLLLAATGAFVAHAFTSDRDAIELHPLAASVAPVAAALISLFARMTDHPQTSEATGVSGVLVGCLAVIVLLFQRVRHPTELERAFIRQSLDTRGHRVMGLDVVSVRASELRPGEEIVVEAGEIVPVDATIVAGTALVEPWLGATSNTSRDEGDSVVAGARVLEGRLRASATWTENDRAFLRLTADPRRRADVHAPLSRLGRSFATRGSIIAATAAALAAFSADRGLVLIALQATVAYAALANAGVAQIAALHVGSAVLAALRRGVVFRTARALDRAGRASVAAFCARGTLLLGEPEVANVEAFGDATPETVLALVAGTESGASHPTAVALQRAARARGVRPDGVRSPVIQAGLGVTAVAASGQTLVVGSRGLMLRERISVALAESRITELEVMGRTVLLAALGGKLVGLVGLQDGLRPGARAAVQHLLDVGIEPVLLSGDTRETCEALGRAVDIDHIRPEVLPQDRGAEIKRLADGGAIVAVLGRSPADDSALSAADVSVALDSAGSVAAEWSVQLVADDVRDSAFALRTAHESRKRAWAGLSWTVAPALAAALLVAIGLAPPTSPILASLAGAAVAAGRLRPRR